tara:strand:- start:3662 stop:4048 length:387 start_codon:yes stop_codon:yes gene_type:complete
MKNLITLIALIILTNHCFAQQLEFVKTIPISYSEKVITISEDIDVSITQKDVEYLRIFVTIEDGVSESIVKNLFKVGRYEIQIVDGEIIMPNINKKISVRGHEVKERVFLQIEAPIWLSVQLGVAVQL